jgi:hypothetical protein
VKLSVGHGGEATVEFSVTRQPGDNFAIAASTNPNDLNAVTVDGTELRTGGGATIDIDCDGTEPICRTDMLTVWRRLHIEVDSMGAVDGNFIAGTIPVGGTVQPNQTETFSVSPTAKAFDSFLGTCL